MVFKLDFMQEKSSTKVSSTDWAQLGGNVSQSNRLQLPDLPSVLVRPKDGQNGLIEFHGKKLILYSDNTFFYGAWPQKKVLPVYQEKLNQALLQNKIRHNGHYYTLNGLAQQEYTVGDKCYVLVENHTCWMEVLPVKWVLDEKKQKAYSDQILVADTQKSSHFLQGLSQQIMQSNKFVRDHNPDSKVFLKKQKRGLKSDLIHLLRTLRDIETIEGKVSPEIQQAYAIFMKQTKDKRRVK